MLVVRHVDVGARPRRRERVDPAACIRNNLGGESRGRPPSVGCSTQRRQTSRWTVTTSDDDLGRSGSGLVERPGFQRLVAAVCSGVVGAVFCIEASRLARNGRDWHHLIDLRALVGSLVVDPDGVYDPRQTNDRLLLGLKGTMSEYELSLLRQRSLESRDSKARRGELRVALPAGYCWSDLGKIEIDPDGICSCRTSSTEIEA